MVLSEEGFLRMLPPPPFFLMLLDFSSDQQKRVACLTIGRSSKRGSTLFRCLSEQSLLLAHRKVQRQCYLAAIEDEETGKLRPPNAGISDFNAHTYTPLPGLVMAATLSCPAYVRL